MAKSNYLEDKVLNHVLKNTAYTPPATVYAALFTTNPTDANTGTEVTGGSYARQAITFGTVASGSVSNSAAITFSSVPAATITHIGVYDASSAGNLLYHAALVSQIITTSGSDVEFDVGAFTVTES